MPQIASFNSSFWEGSQRRPDENPWSMAKVVAGFHVGVTKIKVMADILVAGIDENQT